MKIKYFFVALILIYNICNIGKLSAQVMMPGEKLTYAVSYLGVPLGQINVFVDSNEELNGNKVFKVRGVMNSNPNIPFVELAAKYESWIDLSVAYSHQFIGRVKLDDGSWDYHQIDFDYAKKKVSTKKIINKETHWSFVYNTDKKYNDGMSLFFLARKYTKMKKAIRIPTIVDRDTTFTIINFQNKPVDVKIKAVDYKIKTIYFNGKMEWTGIYGLTGEFEGWFSNDDASIPIRAKMKVYLGSIDIELIDWKRKNWTAPKAD